MMNGSLSLFLQNIRRSGNSNTTYRVFADSLKSCAEVSNAVLGEALHGHVIKLGHISCQLVLKALINMYAKCRALDDSEKLFGEISERDTVVWNILLSGFSGLGKYDCKVIRFFRMLHVAQDPKPSAITLAIVLPVCARSGSLSAGKCVHSYAVKSGLESHTLVGNALISMYAKCGDVFDAAAVFYGISDKDVISWNAIIAGFSENKLMGDALKLFQQMMKGQSLPNYATVANILSVCAGLGGNDGYKFGKEIQCHVLRHAALENEVTVMNSLVSFYSKIGQIRQAESLFRRMKSKDLVSWNSLIAGYALNGEWLKAFELFYEFVDLEMIGPDSVTLISIIPACAELRYLRVGKQIHNYVIRDVNLYQDTTVGNALISFYAKCGCIDSAFRVFLLMPKRDLISCNTLLDAFGEHQLETQLVDLLFWMFREGVKPDSITILNVVQHCAALFRENKVKETHGFSLRSGLLLHDNEPSLGNALLDAYAKCGNLDYASKLFEGLSGKRNIVTCNSMISRLVVYGLHNDANLIFRRMPLKDLTTWNLMVRAYAENECPDEALALFRELQDHAIKPDAMTIMSILPVCAQVASTHLLKQCHAYTIRACFEDVHLNAALLDMYPKCGIVNNAYKLYASTAHKDLVVFTAMIGGYAMHGMGKEALGVFYDMLEYGVKPDHVVITAALSACNHAGLIKEGLMIFNLTEKVYHMKPSMEQYACVVDLLARSGKIKEAFDFVNQMPVPANANIWGTLLGACKTHHDVDMARVIADRLFESESTDIGNYVALSNLFAANASWEGVLEMRRLIRMRDLKKPAGCSWIEVGRVKNVFRAGDHSHPKRSLIYNMLYKLDKQIKDRYKSSHFEVG